MFRAYEDCGKYQRTLEVSKSLKAAVMAAEKAQTTNMVYVTVGYAGSFETRIAFKGVGEDWVSRD